VVHLIRTYQMRQTRDVLPLLPNSISIVSTKIESPLIIPDEIISLGLICYRQITPTNCIETPFFRAAFEVQELEQLMLFEILTPSETKSSIVTDRAFIAPKEMFAFIEADRVVNQENKESLSALMDLADESSCSTLVACVPRDNAHVKSILQSYMSLGFSLSNFVSLSGFLLLVREL